MTETTRSSESVRQGTLYVALELGTKTWTVSVSAGLGTEPVLRTVPSTDWLALDRVLAQARRHFGVPDDGPVISCYEAGRDGFWIHRALAARGIANRVVDSSSIEVNRRARRAKTDRLDARKLVQMLIRKVLGERPVWQEVHVPTAAEEARRHATRERTALTQDRTRLINQVRGWLATLGTRLPTRRRGAWWTTLRDAFGAPLPGELQARLARAWARLTLIEEQLAALETQLAAGVASAAPDTPARRLVALKGIGVTGTAVLLDEGLVWRRFQNRRQIGALFGFAPTPFASGDSMHEQGSGHSGHRRLKNVAIQLAWNWVRWQPDSALTRWYLARFGVGKRARRIGIVALARKLMVALWRYTTTGQAPTGAVLSATV
jgi:transposase